MARFRACPFRARRAPDGLPLQACGPGQHPPHEPSSRPAAPLLRPREFHLSQTAFASCSPYLKDSRMMLADYYTLWALAPSFDRPKASLCLIEDLCSKTALMQPRSNLFVLLHLTACAQQPSIRPIHQRIAAL